MRIHDLSPLVSSKLAVFPGDTPMSREVLLDIAKGDHLTLSTLHATVHLGSHLDAPSHYDQAGRTIDEVDLSRCVGPCRVVDATGATGERVTRDDIPALAGAKGGIEGEHDPDTIDLPERVLIRTGSHPHPERWTDTFRGLDPGLVDHLASRGVRLIGVDVPSVDPESAKVLEAHHRCAARDVLILEGLRLDDVPEGDHELIALPLKLEGFDASPVRAILIERT